MGEPAGRRPAPRPARLTGRAAVLAVVICAIVLSLAYPVREYIAQRNQISQLLAQRQAISAQVNSLRAEQQRLSDPAYIEQQARDQLHMCMPDEKCYVVVGDAQAAGRRRPAPAATPWYSKLWRSVKQASRDPAR
ncbi:MAG TPA: septum formation initiator family protein [Streptosporangiaceae bacterium]|nr:septum formation initiator family protein [Streptosporangiaceae bacterium]